jgi:hypothetical protein
LFLEDYARGFIGLGGIAKNRDYADAVNVGALGTREALAGFPGALYAFGVGVGGSLVVLV